MVLLEAISRGGTDRRLRGRDRWAVCLSERHVKPHLVIGDVAAGQWIDPFGNGDPSRAPTGRDHMTIRSRKGFHVSRCGAGASGRAPPSYDTSPATTFSS